MIQDYLRRYLLYDWHSYLLTIIRAAITPGIQPKRVSINTSKTEPHPLSITAKGGNITQRITRQIDIFIVF